MEEVWKDIPNYEGMYQVSNLGRVKSLSRIIKRYGYYKTKDKILKAHPNKGGYLFVNLYKEKKLKQSYIHKLVANVFIGVRKDLVVNHINMNKQDNRLINLELITQRKNSSYLRKQSTSKYTGVCKCKSDKKWRSTIRIKGKIIHLGRFEKEKDAHLAYQRKLKEIDAKK